MNSRQLNHHRGPPVDFPLFLDQAAKLGPTTPQRFGSKRLIRPSTVAQPTSALANPRANCLHTAEVAPEARAPRSANRTTVEHAQPSAGTNLYLSASSNCCQSCPHFVLLHSADGHGTAVSALSRVNLSGNSSRSVSTSIVTLPPIPCIPAAAGPSSTVLDPIRPSTLLNTPSASPASDVATGP